jgi:hypothetical protein
MIDRTVFHSPKCLDLQNEPLGQVYRANDIGQRIIRSVQLCREVVLDILVISQLPQVRLISRWGSLVEDTLREREITRLNREGALGQRKGHSLGAWGR